MTDFDADIGEIRHVLTVSPPSYAQYLRMQRAMLRSPRRRSIWTLLLWLATVAVVSAGVIWLSEAFMITAVMASMTTDWAIVLSTSEVFLSILAIFCAVFVGVALLGYRTRSRFLKRLYGDLVSEGQSRLVLLGEKGVGVGVGTASSRISWTRVDRLDASGDMHFIVMRGPSALWIPETLMKAEPALEPFIRTRIAAAKAQPPAAT